MPFPPRFAAALVVAFGLLCVPAAAYLLASADEPPSPAPAAAPGLLGFDVEPAQALSAARRAALGIAGDAGVYAAVIVPGGPADLAGLRLGDRVVRIAGRDVPEHDAAPDDAVGHRAWRTATRALVEGSRAGESVAIVLLRGVARVELSVAAVTQAEMHRIQAPDAAAVAAALPPLSDAGAPQAFAESFPAVAGAALPAGFFPYEGRWRVGDEPGAENAVLRQDLPTLPWAVLLVAGAGRAYADGKASVRFKAVSGVADASGGIVFRAKDGRNHYVVRANALEDNFRVYVVKDGARTQLAERKVAPPALGAWHVIEVEFRSSSFRATLDGKDPVEATDSTYASGWCGLWTKADSVTLFDDLAVEPAKPAN